MSICATNRICERCRKSGKDIRQKNVDNREYCSCQAGEWGLLHKSTSGFERNAQHTLPKPLAEDSVELQSNNEAGEVESFIDVHKVKAAFDSFGPHKASGADNLKPIVLQNLPDNIQQWVADIYKGCVRTGYTPTTWKKMKVVFIPKQGKSDYASTKAYTCRPITLSNFILKALERVIKWYVLENIVSKPLPHQHAYTRGLSTETALTTFVNSVEKMVHQGKRTLAVSLDCSGAFNKIKFNSARMALERSGVLDEIIKWYDKML